MNLGELIRIWRRRSILTAVLLIVAWAGTAVALIRLPRTYQSDASVVLLASPSAAKLNGGNPYMSFSSSLTLTGDVLSRELMAPQTVIGLAARGFTDPYTVTLATYNTATTGSVLQVAVNGNDKSAVERQLYAVTSQISVALARLQANLAPYSRIRVATISFAPQATLSVSQTARPLVMIIVPGLLVALGIPVVVDGLIARQRNRELAALSQGGPKSADRVALGAFRR